MNKERIKNFSLIHFCLHKRIYKKEHHTIYRDKVNLLEFLHVSYDA